jgi:hypothetical protein
MYKYFFINKSDKYTSFYAIAKISEDLAVYSVSSLTLSSKQDLLTSFKILAKSLLECIDSSDIVIGVSRSIPKNDFMNVFLFLAQTFNPKIKVIQLKPETCLSVINSYHKYLYKKPQLKDWPALWQKFLKTSYVQYINSETDTVLSNMPDEKKALHCIGLMCCYYLYRKNLKND